MTPAAAKRLRLAARLVGALALLALVAAGLAGGWFYSRLRASLPLLDGPAKISGLAAPVSVERDALGVPTLRAQNRLDLARALGWLHAQERFFQMDLQRRSAAGELAELFGKIALSRDRETRRHGFRTLAQKVLAQLAPPERALLEAYTAGANAGLTALGEKPFEYLMLRSDPRPWRPEDCVLTIYAMTIDLQDADARYDRTLMTLRDQLGAETLAFFAPTHTPDDAALDGSTAPLAPIPSPKVIDLRLRPKSTVALPPRLTPDPLYPGSNAFALSGAHTATGAALLASDPHLDHGVPNIWYRASLEWTASPPSGSQLSALNAQPTSHHRVVGVTLPGLPSMVIGSNGHIAWGLTDSYADTGDLIVLQTDPIATTLYTAPGQSELLKIEKRRETILVHGADPVTVDYDWTIWGPVIATTDKQRPIVYHWTAHDPAATNFAFFALEDATTVAAAVAVAHRSGMPAHNFIVADSAGDIAWTVAGAVPKRVGYDGRLPTNWAFGDRRWDGLLADAIPSIIKPASGRLWSANNRMIGGDAFALLGDGGYARPARAAQIRDDLAPLERATPRDLLGIQLDDRALFLASWQKILLATLPPAVTAEKKSRAELRTLVENWTGRATVDSVSYRLVHDFRASVAARVYPSIFESCLETYPRFSWKQLPHENALQALLREKPPHLLNPAFSSWDALLVAAADDVVTRIEKSGTPLSGATWGRANTVRLRHPLAAALPAWLPTALTAWLRFPPSPLPGDADMPRLQAPGHGASMRLVVSPGRETEGLFHMPGGQSGHPLSPFFRAGHEAWERGDPTPLLPGPTTHTVTLTP